MEDISFSIYLDNKLQKTTFQDLTSNRRVLFCSIARIYQHLTNVYINRIIDQLPFYYNNGIDEVYLVFSSGGVLPLARIDKLFPDITGLADIDQTFVTHMRNHAKKTTESLDYLAQFWSYHALLNNGEVEQFYEQPTDNYMKNLIKAGLKPNKTMRHLLATEGDKFVLQRHLVSRFEQFTNDKNLPNYEHRDEKNYPFHECTPLEFMYFNLCPNKKLNEYLLDTSKQTSI